MIDIPSKDSHEYFTYVVYVHVALNLAGKQSEAANLLKHLAENAVTENRYDTLPKLGRKPKIICLILQIQ